MIEKNTNDLCNSEVYKELISTRKKITRPLALLMLAVYYIYILVIAFSPETLAAPVGDGPATLGIVVGLGIILFSFVITGIAVHLANTRLEPLTQTLHRLAEGHGGQHDA